MRSREEGVTEHFNAPKTMDLEEALEYIGDDELVEVTPQNVRIRKIYLKEIDQKRAKRKEGSAVRKKKGLKKTFLSPTSNLSSKKAGQLFEFLVPRLVEELLHKFSFRFFQLPYKNQEEQAQKPSGQPFPYCQFFSLFLFFVLPFRQTLICV